MNNTAFSTKKPLEEDRELQHTDSPHLFDKHNISKI